MMLFNTKGTQCINIFSISRMLVYINKNKIYPKKVVLEINGEIFEEILIDYPEDDGYTVYPDNYIEKKAIELVENITMSFRYLAIKQNRKNINTNRVDYLQFYYKEDTNEFKVIKV